MSWTKPLPGWRRVETRVGDSLPTIAARELGDAARWPDLAQINGLVPPYVTDDPAEAGPGVLLSGDPIQIPAPAASALARAGVTDADDPFGQDIALTNGRVTATDGGDFRLVAGVANLNQALRHALATDPGALPRHPRYGCRARALIGRGGDAVNNQLAAAFVARALRADRRIARVVNATAAVTGDALSVEATAVAADGRPVPVRMTDALSN